MRQQQELLLPGDLAEGGGALYGPFPAVIASQIQLRERAKIHPISIYGALGRHCLHPSAACARPLQVMHALQACSRGAKRGRTAGCRCRRLPHASAAATLLGHAWLARPARATVGLPCILYSRSTVPPCKSPMAHGVAGGHERDSGGIQMDACAFVCCSSMASFNLVLGCGLAAQRPQ